MITLDAMNIRLYRNEKMGGSQEVFDELLAWIDQTWPHGRVRELVLTDEGAAMHAVAYRQGPDGKPFMAWRDDCPTVLAGGPKNRHWQMSSGEGDEYEAIDCICDVAMETVPFGGVPMPEHLFAIAKELQRVGIA